MLATWLLMAGVTLTPSSAQVIDKELGRSTVIGILKETLQAPSAIGVVRKGSGGTLKNQWLELHIPAGAIAQSDNLSVTPLIFNKEVVGFVLQPFDLKIQKPLQLTIGKKLYQLNVKQLGSYLLLPDVKGRPMLIDLRQIMRGVTPSGKD